MLKIFFFVKKVISLYKKIKVIGIMKSSVKNIQYRIGQKVYWSEGATEEYYRGTIIDCLKISVRIIKTDGDIETINKRNLGIVI